MEMVKKVKFSMKDEVVEPLLGYLRHMTQTNERNPSTSYPSIGGVSYCDYTNIFLDS